MEAVAAIAAGYRMPCPRHASPVLYQLMLACWEFEPLARPSFSVVRDEMCNILKVALIRGGHGASWCTRLAHPGGWQRNLLCSTKSALFPARLGTTPRPRDVPGGTRGPRTREAGTTACRQRWLCRGPGACWGRVPPGQPRLQASPASPDPAIARVCSGHTWVTTWLCFLQRATTGQPTLDAEGYVEEARARDALGRGSPSSRPMVGCGTTLCVAFLGSVEPRCAGLFLTHSIPPHTHTRTLSHTL